MAFTKNERVGGMKIRRAGKIGWLLAVMLVASRMVVWGAEVARVLEPGMKLAVVGDSITEQKIYSAFMEVYLTVCEPQLAIETAQFGWSGERAPGFVRRMDNDLAWFKPDVVTVCYGMNDGAYGPYKPSIGATYYGAMSNSVSRLKAAGVTVVVGSPGAVDTYYFRPGLTNAAVVYNENLATLGDWAHQVAVENGFPFADLHTVLTDSMAKAKAVLGETYDVCGRDGVHPRSNGHLVMAYGFLKALGLEGDIGTIAVSMKTSKATASHGHKVIRTQDGKVELESTRYPFCFDGDEKTGTQSILPYVPFSDDLNRLVLKVSDLPYDKAKITWGASSQVFSKGDLEKGINLAAEFIPNPFNASFAKVQKAVVDRQNFERILVNDWVTRIPHFVRAVDGDQVSEKAMQDITLKLVAKRAKMQEAVSAAFVPVRHLITIEAETP